MSAVVMVVGDGLLADIASKELADGYTVIRRINIEPEMQVTPDLALLLHDGLKPSIFKKTEALLHHAGIPWLRGFVSFGEGVIGPLVRSGKPGCSQCADKRRLMAGRDRKEMWEMENRLGLQGEMPRDAWASRMALLQMASLLKEEARNVLEGNQAYSEGRLFLMNLKSLKGSWHSFLPDPLCPMCSRLPEDSPEAAQISLQASPKISANSYRCRSLDDLKSVLAKDYLDHRTGLLNGKMMELALPFADVSVNLPLLAGDEGAAGRTHSYTISEATAILEGLERYCGLSPLGKRTVVHDSFRNLEGCALNPVEAGVHAPEQYARPDFPFKAFDPDLPIHWVWGYSLLQKRPILVPELLAYYSLGCGGGFVYETSNGCALGGSLEEAVFYGIMEVVERDSFLMTWYGELPLPCLDPFSADDRELTLMIKRVRAVGGYDLHFYNSTMENGIPSVLVLAKNRKKKGLNLICAAGSHLDPIRAAKSAVHELAGMMLILDEQFESNKQDYLRMLHDPSLVQKMDDHGMLYGLPEAEERLYFLLDQNNRPFRTFDEEFKQKEWHADLTEDLKEVLHVFGLLNLDVIVVDQTTPELSKNGLFCVKVLIPGMLPMTFGQHLIRVTGLERVLKVPMELGYKKQPLTLEQLNPHPHPFP